MRNVFVCVGKKDWLIVMVVFRIVFDQDILKVFQEYWVKLIEVFELCYLKLVELMCCVEDDVFVYKIFLNDYWLKIYLINLLEWFNKEIKWRMNVVGIFLNEVVVICLVGVLMLE